MEVAQQHICVAKRLQKSGKLDEAFDNYQIALSGLLELYKTDQDPKRKTVLGALIEEYMSDAESLKQSMKTEKTFVKSISSMFFGTKAAAVPVPVPSQRPVTDSFDYTAESRAKRANASETKVEKSESAVSSITKKLSSVTSSTSVPTTKPSAVGAKGTPETKTTGAAKTVPKLTEYETQIMTEMMDATPGVGWDDIAGLAYAKQTLQEAVILPNLRPDLFTGLRSPPKGVLLFGPPGTGKTLLAKAVATESGFAFFSVTAANVTSKYLGEGEKLMKAVFNLARILQPTVIFFDEIDALMSSRKESEHEASRRLKTEFMTQIDGATTSKEDRLLIMGATNIPWELDEAVLRRLVKRIYVPLPDPAARKRLVVHLMTKQGSGGVNIIATEDRLSRVVSLTDGYSGSDLTAVCQEAAMGPIRELGPKALLKVKAEDVRPLTEKDFLSAVENIRPSVSPESLAKYAEWSDQFGVSK